MSHVVTVQNLVFIFKELKNERTLFAANGWVLRDENDKPLVEDLGWGDGGQVFSVEVSDGVEFYDFFTVSFFPEKEQDAFEYSGFLHLPEHYAEAVRLATGWPGVVSDNDFLFYLSQGDVTEGIEPHVMATRNPAVKMMDGDDERTEGMVLAQHGGLELYRPRTEFFVKWYTLCTEERARQVEPEFFGEMGGYCPIC